MHAASLGHEKAVLLLLQAGADRYAIVKPELCSLYHGTSQRFRTHRIILPRNLPANSQNLAAAHGHLKLAHVILGVDPSKMSLVGACLTGNVTAVEGLLKQIPKAINTLDFPLLPSSPTSSSSSSSSSMKQVNDKGRNTTTSLYKGQCEVCLDEDALCACSICHHASACQECLVGHVCSRIETDIASWIPCPAINCEEPLDSEHLYQALITDTQRDPWRFPIGYLNKQLVRIPEWVKCENIPSKSSGSGDGGGGGNGGDSCLGGVLVSSSNEGQTVSCPLCRKNILAQRAVEEDDDEIKKMKAEGIIRSCPACRHPTMKEKGVCNVISCEVCGIWWNWRTGDTGKSSHDLKQKARARGTLWEPGELAYQQTLQHSDPAAFKALLERNGVKYDPNYSRGS
mmetsp:Transcript_27139/g.32045  ORF Transcript_27139/g.32045 Transcript_27139/m.32045 type:complete len:399 (+) Transcript_27139:435-1631(+)